MDLATQAGRANMRAAVIVYSFISHRSMIGRTSTI
jgi:hypothetical protein